MLFFSALRKFIFFRPKFLQYKYLYDYRQNYYDDVLEVLDSRRKGYRRDIPRAQTWAERVLRSHSHPLYKLEAFDRFLEDTKLITRSRISGYVHSHYLKESFNKRSSRIAIL